VIGRDLDPDGPMPTEHREPKGWERRATEREQANAEAMGALRQMVTHLGGIFENTKAAPRNDVLAQMTQQIPANGVLHKGWEQLAQAFTISNFGSSQLTVTTQGIQSQAPSVGSGVAVVPAGVERTVMLRGNAVTIYGTPGALVEFVAYARPRPPHSSLCISGPAAQLVAVNNPAAGAEFSVNPSPSSPFSIVALEYTLTTSATAANRDPGLLIGSLFVDTDTNQAASQTQTYGFWPGFGNNTGIPTGPFPAGTVVASSVGLLQAGDQISAVTLMIEIP
jgi:hypothetical protein